LTSIVNRIIDDGMIESWIFYLIVLGFGFLAIYLMDIGIFK